MDENQRLRTKRRGIKASVMKLIAKVETMISADLESVSTKSVSESQKVLAETTLTQLKVKKDQIMELDTAIAAKIDSELEFEEETTEADTYEMTLEERIALLSEFIRKVKLPPPPPDSNPLPPVTLPISSPPTQLPSDTSSHSHSADTTKPAAANPSHVSTSTHSLGDISRIPKAVTRLPKHSLPTFSGDPLRWQSFWDSFDAAINANTGLSGVQKFNYLRELVQGDAARVIAGFSLTDDNYTHSVDLLKGRYGQSYKIINATMDALLNLWKPSNSLSSLQAFHDTIEQHMRALTSLGKASDSYGAMLAPSVLSKLPAETKKYMAHDHHDSEWSIKDIMSGLLKEIQILDMSQQYSGKPSMHDNIPIHTASFHTHANKGSYNRDSQQKKTTIMYILQG